MKFAILAASIATLAPLASAAGYQAAWTIKGDTCDGQISLGEYTATPATCTPKDCGPIPGNVPGLSTKNLCVETHTGASKEILGSYNKPYVLVEVYKADSDCAGAFDVAVGVIADGTCYSGTNGKASYNVTWTAEAGTVWLQYDDALCKGKETKVEIPNAVADGKNCLLKNLKAYAVAPAAAGSMESEEEEYGSKSMAGDMTMAPGASVPAPADGAAPTTAPAVAATPAPTTSAASTSFVSAAAVATFAVAAVALA